MPTPTLITDLSITAAANSPSGSDSPATLDDIQRAHASFIAQLAAGTNFTAPVLVTSGGTGRASGVTAFALKATGTTATGAEQSLGIGATTDLLVGGGGAALPVWTAATGTGAPVRATSPTITLANLSTCTADGANEIGFRHVPQISQSAAYTLVLSDAGKHILHPSTDVTARIFTIPANAAVAFPIGTAITFVNQVSAGVVTIAITTDVMRLAGTGTTGSRTLNVNGVATALKLTATEWLISGSALA